MPPVFDLEKCSGCGTCDSICPADAIYMEELNQDNSGKKKRIPYLKYPDECWHCGSCRQDCPQSAIKIKFPPDMLCI
jgi:NAD-dependent dihydropyrimidine dehydrogenase PreA subunit